MSVSDSMATWLAEHETELSTEAAESFTHMITGLRTSMRRSPSAVQLAAWNAGAEAADPMDVSVSGVPSLIVKLPDATVEMWYTLSVEATAAAAATSGAAAAAAPGGGGTSCKFSLDVRVSSADATDGVGSKRHQSDSGGVLQQRVTMCEYLATADGDDFEERADLKDAILDALKAAAAPAVDKVDILDFFLSLPLPEGQPHPKQFNIRTSLLEEELENMCAAEGSDSDGSDGEDDSDDAAAQGAAKKRKT